jgi:hypothetical protein
MNLQRVSRGAQAAVTLTCCLCKHPVREVAAYADLDGKPFIDYYCEPCAEVVAPKQVDALVTLATKIV